MFQSGHWFHPSDIKRHQASLLPKSAIEELEKHENKITKSMENEFLPRDQVAFAFGVPSISFASLSSLYWSLCKGDTVQGGANTRCWGLAATALSTRSAPPTAGLPSSATRTSSPSSASPPPPSRSFHFQELGGNCTADEIRSAYRRLALQRHPDKLAQFGVSPAAFQELAAAYKVFSDPRARVDWLLL
ncbi:hypothetical protein RJ640_005333 [Escallonia rubra]|uniref:J domain-containing protein n=1 Tax=Escallonia rubra TaxID=112253 RepID=A0AA88QBG5_9ASTE|nr:hypothetical protein RJ640_005333 [Escallonia rubra]